MSVATQISARFGGAKRDRYIEFANETLKGSFPDAKWELLDFNIEAEGFGKILSIDVFEPESRQIAFRVEPVQNGWNNRQVSVQFWSDGKPAGEWTPLRDSRDLANEIADLPAFKAIYPVLRGLGSAA